MYTIKAVIDGVSYPIHNPKIKALTVGEPYFECGDNMNGQAEFTVYPGHPYYSKVKKLVTDITFYNDGVEEFSGRVLYDDEDFRGVKKVFVEGELAFFCDSVQRPKVYHGTSVRAYLRSLIDNHNSQVEDRKRFQLGRVTVTDSNNSLYRYSNWETTRECLSEKLVKRLGGHFVIRKENGIRYLDYLSDEDFYVKSKQTVHFGKNLLDFAKNISAADIATCVIPLGAKLDEPDQDESLGAIADDQRLTIAGANGGVDYVTDDNAVAAYGNIYKTVIYDNVTVAANLIKKGKEYLASTQFEKMVLEVKAIDLSLTSDDIASFAIGNQVRCISQPHGLDHWFPLSKKRIYCTKFKKNTLTLGTEMPSATYTSSNQQHTATMEEAINAIPSKREILQQALRDAQDLINAQVASGYAIHEPNEFIVADHTDYKKQASNLWRWGLGGLAHYSEGYDGPVDGIALTMDGKINGKMVMAGSILAESIDIGYRQEVESTIDEAETSAKDYADGKVRVAKQTIENSITNLENRINLSVSSTKETVAKKNYVVSGEQETLNTSAFSLSGDCATVSLAEYQNQKCLKLTFTSSGTFYIRQDLGTLPGGTYTITVQAAFEDAGTRPTSIMYGFSNNDYGAFLSNYTAGEFHVFRWSLAIQKTDRTVSVGVSGSAGQVIYITNIRCLRQFQELLDDLDARLTVDIGAVRASVTDVYENSQHNYCINGSFNSTGDAFDGWYRSNTELITKQTFEGKSCARIANIYSFSYIRQTIKNPKSGPFRIRIKAACDPGQEGLVKIRFYFGGSSSPYPYIFGLSASWKTFEFDFSEIAEGWQYFYIYNYASYKTTIYVTDIEILGYVSAFSESQLSILQDSIAMEVSRATGIEDTLRSSIKLNADNITSCVTKDNVGSYITQYYDKVIVAFNNNSKYVQIGAGNIAIYDNGVTNSKKRAVFDESGNHFYRDSYYVGKIGTNVWSGNNSHKGLSFDLEYNGKFMSFSYRESRNDVRYTSVFAYSRANSLYTKEGLHCGADLYGEGFTLSEFEIGRITAGNYSVPSSAAVPFISTLKRSGDTMTWTHSKLRFFNGIYVGYWN